MCFTNGSYISWSWMRNADVFSDGEKNTTAVTPERPRVPQSSLKQHLTQPKSASRCTPVESQCMGDEKQDKSVASYAAPPPTSARSAGSLRGTGVGSQAEKKAQIEVAHRPNPVAVRN